LDDSVVARPDLFSAGKSFGPGFPIDRHAPLWARIDDGLPEWL
jgi:hypothetical protein